MYEDNSGNISTFVSNDFKKTNAESCQLEYFSAELSARFSLIILIINGKKRPWEIQKIA